MQLRRLLSIAILGSSVVLLSACSSTGTSAHNGVGANGANSGGVQTGGLGANGSGSDNGLPNPNAMVPGANQTYYFDFNQSNVHQSDLPSIQVQSQYLMSHASAHVLLQGNTDMRGSREYNMALGQRRADAVAKTLRLDGVSKGQVSTISYGAERPIAMGHTSHDYALNRRVHLVYQSH